MLPHLSTPKTKRRLPAGEVGDHVDGLAGPVPGLEAGAVPGDPRDLGGVREVQIVDGQYLDDAGFFAAVALAAVVELRGRPIPGQRAQPRVQRRPVLLHGERVVRLLRLDEEDGVVTLCV